MAKTLTVHPFLVSPKIITYRDYLPLLLGRRFRRFIPPYRGYDESVDSRISNVFTLAFRFAHASIRPTVGRLDENYRPITPEIRLGTSFFAVWRIIQEGESLSAALQCRFISFVVSCPLWMSSCFSQI